MDKRPRLTTYSQRRVDGGATRGSGTDVCGRCRKEKEPARVNYMLCLKCDRPMAKQSRRYSGPSVTRRTRIVR